MIIRHQAKDLRSERRSGTSVVTSPPVSASLTGWGSLSGIVGRGVVPSGSSGSCKVPPHVVLNQKKEERGHVRTARLQIFFFFFHSFTHTPSLLLLLSSRKVLIFDLGFRLFFLFLFLFSSFFFPINEGSGIVSPLLSFAALKSSVEERVKEKKEEDKKREKRQEDKKKE